ncbi:uncharacterized protein LOC141904002 [Tubulanus polymorphus]|uniref:uncharacterized protein LOC141904002 n=1 Tax=Tubulanus polymorphus TaxID=672921 RepID=UPI003DA2681B
MDFYEGIDAAGVIMMDENYWYENELKLAAELGKTLLERNKELENQLNLAHQLSHDRYTEITFLRQQVDTLREMNQSKMRIYEEIDRNSQETEKLNKTLERENKSDREKIKRLQEAVESVESRCQDLQTEIDQLQKEKRAESKNEKLASKRMSSSFPSLHDIGDFDRLLGNNGNNNQSMNLREVEIVRLRENLRNVRARLAVDEHRRDELQAQLELAEQLNKQLTGELAASRDDSKRLRVVDAEMKDLELRVARAENNKLCEKCRTRLENVDTEPALPISDLEHDINEIRHGQVLKMDNGGSVFGSKESLRTAGIDTYDFESQFDINLLSELDQQYHRLVQKYESLIEAKRRSLHVDGAASPTTKKSQEVQTFAATSTSEAEYKKIFEEIFSTLRRSISYDDVTSRGAAATSVGKHDLMKS